MCCPWCKEESDVRVGEIVKTCQQCKTTWIRKSGLGEEGRERREGRGDGEHAFVRKVEGSFYAVYKACTGAEAVEEKFISYDVALDFVRNISNIVNGYVYEWKRVGDESVMLIPGSLQPWNEQIERAGEDRIEYEREVMHS